MMCSFCRHLVVVVPHWLTCTLGRAERGEVLLEEESFSPSSGSGGRSLLLLSTRLNEGELKEILARVEGVAGEEEGEGFVMLPGPGGFLRPPSRTLLEL